MPYYLLNEEEIALLRKIRAKVLGLTSRVQNPSKQEFSDLLPPETYVAWPPAAGIPAMAIKGTGIGGEDDEPGGAVCSLFKINSDGQLVDTGYTETVYNITTSVIAQDWILVTRTKFGKWIAVTTETLPSGVNNNDMLFWNTTGTGSYGFWDVLTAPSTTGNWALTVQAGVLKWSQVQSFTCP